MGEISDSIKVITSLTSAKAAALAVVFLFLIGMVVVYEIQTSQFQLTRLSRVTELLTELEPLTQADSPEIQRLARSAAAELALAMERDSEVGSTPIDPRILLAILLSAPWAILSLVGFGEAVQGVSDWYYGTLGCLLIGGVFGVIGYAIPVDIHWFYRYVCLPILLTGTTLFTFWAIGNAEGDSGA